MEQQPQQQQQQYKSNTCEKYNNLYRKCIVTEESEQKCANFFYRYIDCMEMYRWRNAVIASQKTT